MTRLKSYAICFCLSVTIMAEPSPISGQEPLKASHFLTEAPNGWQALQASVRQMEGKCVVRNKAGIHPLVIFESRFKLNGKLLVFEETRKLEEGKIIRFLARGVNSKYQFTLHQNTPQSPWTLAGHDSPLDYSRLDHPYGSASVYGVVRFLHAPFTVNFVPMSEMIKEAGFKVEKIDDQMRDGKKLAKIEFSYTPTKAVNGKPSRLEHLTSMRGGWMVLDPGMNWALQECSLDVKGGEKNSCVVEYSKTEGGQVLPSRVFEKTDAVSTLEATFSDLKIRDVPEQEFTLSAYGLPEPVGITAPSSLSRWYIWIGLAGWVALGVGILARLYIRRIQAREPGKKA